MTKPEFFQPALKMVLCADVMLNSCKVESFVECRTKSTVTKCFNCSNVSTASIRRTSNLFETSFCFCLQESVGMHASVQQRLRVGLQLVHTKADALLQIYQNVVPVG